MVVEELFKTKWAEKRPSYSLYLGVLLTIISFVTSYLIFNKTPSFIGISTILFTVILALINAPTVSLPTVTLPSIKVKGLLLGPA